jgi:hypothetical protein
MPDDPLGEIRTLGLAEPNYDERNLLQSPPPLRDPGAVPPRDEERREWLGRFAAEVYGDIPPAPLGLEIERQPIPAEHVERILIRLKLPNGRFEVDAALWLPEASATPAPMVLGLDFDGPIGILTGDGFPLDTEARLPPVFEGDGRLTDALRGTSSYRWPTDYLRQQGFAVLVSCYCSWVPDDPEHFGSRGLAPLVGGSVAGARPGAIALWAWAISRLVDVAQRLPEIDPGRIAVAGHSRLGKAALLAAATDTRIGAALINNSGAMGASLSQRNFGETRQHLEGRFPHWLSPDAGWRGAPLDQHQLLAAIAPRRLYVTSASEDLWADPKGEYLALLAAAPAWDGVVLPPLTEVFTPGQQAVSGPVAWHLRPGPHDIRPYDWHRFIRHLDW